MASKNSLEQAAGASIDGFFSKEAESKPKQAARENQKPSYTDELYRTGKQQDGATPQTAQKPEIGPRKSISAETKPQKSVMGFRAEMGKIEVWKLYAEAAGLEIGVMCTTAIDEYIRNHELTDDQKQIFDIKMNALEAEKRIKKLAF